MRYFLQNKLPADTQMCLHLAIQKENAVSLCSKGGHNLSLKNKEPYVPRKIDIDADAV